MTLGSNLFINFMRSFLDHCHLCHCELGLNELKYDFWKGLERLLWLHNVQLYLKKESEIKVRNI